MYNKKWAFEGFKLKLLTLETLYEYKNKKKKEEINENKGNKLENSVSNIPILTILTSSFNTLFFVSLRCFLTLLYVFQSGFFWLKNTFLNQVYFDHFIYFDHVYEINTKKGEKLDIFF